MLFKSGAAMQHATIDGIGKPISCLVQGTVMVPGDNELRAHALLDGVLVQGCTAFDTAHVYSNGENERSFGRWLESRGIRDQVVIIAKGAHQNADRNCVTPFDISAHLHDSLARLKTDHIDLYMLHRDDPSQPVGPIMEALNGHLRAGMIGAIGASNWTARRFAEANAYAAAHGLHPFCVSSPQFSLAEMINEPWENCHSISGPQGESDRVWYQENEVPLLPWSPLAGGFLSGTVSRQNVRQHTGQLYHRCYACEANLTRVDRLHELSREKRCTVPQLALAWLLQQPLNLIPVVGPRHPREFEQLIKSFDLQLTAGELEWLDLERDVRI